MSTGIGGLWNKPDLQTRQERFSILCGLCVLLRFRVVAVVCVCAFQDEEDHAVHIRLYPTAVSIRLS